MKRRTKKERKASILQQNGALLPGKSPNMSPVHAKKYENTPSSGGTAIGKYFELSSSVTKNKLEQEVIIECPKEFDLEEM